MQTAGTAAVTSSSSSSSSSGHPLDYHPSDVRHLPPQVHSTQQVADGAAQGTTLLRVDAAVNAANALCSAAELLSYPDNAQLLQRAVGLYTSALSQEEDALVRSPGCVT